jgi:hypothetical protein
LIVFRENGKPREMLRCVNPAEAELLDNAAGVHVRFRLGGTEFPPTIYYKIFVHKPIVDVNSFAPRDYTKKKQPPPIKLHNKGYDIEDKSREGWYKRVENNDWRPMNPVNVIREQAMMPDFQAEGLMQRRLERERKKLQEEGKEFHYSKIVRKQDIEKRKKKRKMEWAKKMLEIRKKLLQEKQAQQKKDETEKSQKITVNLRSEAFITELDDMSEQRERDLEDQLEAEVTEMLKWTEELDFEKYAEQWDILATSLPSDEQSKNLNRMITCFSNRRKTKKEDIGNANDIAYTAL